MCVGDTDQLYVQIIKLLVLHVRARYCIGTCIFAVEFSSVLVSISLLPEFLHSLRPLNVFRSPYAVQPYMLPQIIMYICMYMYIYCTCTCI